MMIFRILCGEWIEPLYDCMRATSPVSFLFFLTALVIGNFLVSQRGKLSKVVSINYFDDAMANTASLYFTTVQRLQLY